MSNPASQPVQQNQQTNNAKYVSIIPENGTSFVEGQKIIYNLDPSLGWIKGRDSYLVFDIENNGTVPMKLCLRKGGISSIIKQVNIFSKHNGMLLETLDNYNQWTSCEMEYSNDDTTNLSNIEGAKPYQQPWRGQEPHINNVNLITNYKNSFHEPVLHKLSGHTTGLADMRTAVRYCCPLRSGIFRHWDSEKLVPILQLGGLRIEIVLAPSLEVLDMPWTGSDIFSGGHLMPSIGDSTDAPTPVKLQNALTAQAIVDISNIMDASQCGLYVGQSVSVKWTNGGAQALATTINSIDQNGAGGRVRLTLADNLTSAIVGGTGKIHIRDADITADNIKYRIVGSEFRLLQEQPPNDKMANMDYVFTSYDLFRDTIPSTQTNFNQDITSVASKAVSLFTMYESPAHDAILQFPLQNYYDGQSPSGEGVNLNSVVYFINNKLYPLRAYNPSKYGDRVICLNELVKAFKTIGVVPKCLGSSEYADLGEYTNRFLHARELARGQSVFNLQNAEPQIRLGFSGARGNNVWGQAVGNMKMSTFVFSKKVIHIDGESGLTMEH